ncbi:DNA repair protein-like protein [Hapsidospora chrysogenum ATCC 11550]|uniref:DNA repair protein-like protein n=1 Tax=Hapsidospora chrysogenum (strain ATCC 11550 / CBS 779.69 / DSM 880 / IAM 14645 / JCM 23072 / IMI 49137) TaxID=857340 RepID=A0A086TC51_HAPC1|nr:DNA repair protein-like protein [Hapsidospora chrysogenum ATCC 11550]
MMAPESQTLMDRGGRAESQDSQALYEAMREELGVPALSGQAREPDAHQDQGQLGAPHYSGPPGQGRWQFDVDKPVSDHWDASRSVAQQTSATVVNVNLEAGTVSSHAASTEPCIEVPQSLESGHRENDPHIETRDHSRPTTRNDARLSYTGETAGTTTVAVAKMDASQQTPTQVNVDRDYHEACDSLLSSPGRETSKHTQDGNDERTLHADDTGAVNFGNLSQSARPSSQVSEDPGFENTRGDWRHADQTPQQPSNYGFTPFKPYGGALPETPALPKNPFGGTKQGIAAPFAGSQLFGQTQFSSAMKPLAVSPTSSRPSPNLLHNSISPNVPEESPLQGRTNVSSPTDMHTSSPQKLDDVPATVSRPKRLERIEEETPSHNRSTRQDAVSQSPTGAPPPRSSSSRQPLAHYENMKKSQERKLTDESIYDFVGSDSDDDAIKRLERRKRVERKKARAALEMERVSFTPLPRRDSGDRPNKRRRVGSDSEVHKMPERVLQTSDPSGSSGAPLVVDSQRREAASNEAAVDESTQGTEDPAPDREAMQVHNGEAADDDYDEQHEAEDRIPATSPAPSPSPDEAQPQPHSEPDLPLPVEKTTSLTQGDDTGTSSLPPTHYRTRRTYGSRSRGPRRNTVLTSSASEPISKGPVISSDRAASPSSSPASTAVLHDEDDEEKMTPEEDDTEVAPDSKAGRLSSEPKLSTKSSAPVITPARKKRQNSSAPASDAEEGAAAAASPDTSSLSSAPPSPALTRPTARDSPGSELSGSVNLPSPPLRHGRRKLAQRAGRRKPASLPLGARPVRAAKKLAPHYGSQSSDELHESPGDSVLEKSIVHPKASRTFRQQSLGAASRGGRLFDGMVFAISFQSSKATDQSRIKLEGKLVQAGAVILSEGFEELFDPSTAMETTLPVFDQDGPMTLCGDYGETGFTALIADGHSRKAKYMQALALGLPCLAHQWVTACLGKGELVDWEPYLLCSGASAILDNALRSRSLAAYPAADARLAEVVDQRRKLLQGQRILVVVDSKKSRAGAKQPYIFLAQALGPSISRVFTTEQAREALTAHARKGRPFDWIYVDKGAGTAEAVLSPPEVGGKKRKRNSAPAAAHLFGDTRVLNDEMVIQSLILGRMVEEDEINF